MRAARSGRTLSADDAALVKGMLNRRDRQNDIAAYFGVNGGRITEINTGEEFPEVQAATSDLPPSAPYVLLPAALRTDIKTALQESRTQLSGNLLKVLDEVVLEMDRSDGARRGV